MKRNYLKTVMLATLSVVMAATLFSGCGSSGSSSKDNKVTNKDPKSYSGTITMWSWSDEEGHTMVKNFNKIYPNIKVKLTIVPDQNQSYQNKLTQILHSGTNVPDVFLGESAVIKRLANMKDAWEDLSQAPYNAEDIAKKMVPYSVDIARDKDGKIRALSYQATPGAIFYKRDIAKQYLGTDDPVKVSDMISTVDKLIETAEKLKQASNGKVYFFPGQEEMVKVYEGARDTGWVKDNKLVIDPKMMEYLDVAKKMRDKGLEEGLQQWQAPWAAAFSKDNVFSFALPTWGLPYTIEANDKGSKDAGKWGLAKSPIPYYWGGTWVGMYSKSKNKDLAWQFIKCVTTNKDYLEEWATERGDFVNNLDIINEKVQSSEVNKTINQNTYKEFQPMLQGINGKILTEYDDTIESAWKDNVNLYLAGKCSKDEMLSKFKAKVHSDLPDISVN